MIQLKSIEHLLMGMFQADTADPTLPSIEGFLVVVSIPVHNANSYYFLGDDR